MTLVENNFRGDVFWSSTYGKGPSFSQEFSKSKVCQLEIAIISNQKVLWFQVTENDIFRMQVFEAWGHSCSVETSLVGAERFHVSQVSKKLSSVD